MKKFHQYLGLLMLLPLIAWAITGVFFFVKPGYKAAYESLPVKTYPLTDLPQIQVDDRWNEVRWLRSILGNHLLVKRDQGWTQLNATTLNEAILPSEQALRLLINDAITINPVRYGKIKSVDGSKIETDTEVEISINWSQMSLYQTGSDTRFINNMYKVHYLQWTGIQSVDKILGLVGLGLMVLLASLGLLMMFRRKEAIQ